MTAKNSDADKGMPRVRSTGVALSWFLAASVMALIFIASAIPGNIKPDDPFAGADKVEHFLAYGLLAFALYRAVRATSPGRSRLFHASATVIVAALYGLTDEGHQHFVPGRSMSALDWYADSFGASAMTFVMHLTRTIGGRDT
jgi:hypothetical protein